MQRNPGETQVRLIGANAEAISKGEDRQLFKEAMLRIGLDVPRSGARAYRRRSERDCGRDWIFPLIIRPAFTLGGAGGGIAYNRQEFEEIVRARTGSISSRAKC